MICPIILCGGSGTRLWPSSRKSYPKQFSQLLGEGSLYQATIERLSGPEFQAPIVLTNADFRFLAADQAYASGCIDPTVIIEPVSRNTAPAILVAALHLENSPDTLMLIAPSDHLIADDDDFRKTVLEAAPEAEKGRLVTFGITPDTPETGYGYLELGEKAVAGAAQPLLSFTEKPNAEDAVKMLSDGRYLWNAGIFLFRVRDILAAFEAHEPAMIAKCRRALDEGEADLNFFRLAHEPYSALPDISIDYAVMEKADNLSAVPYGGTWSDLGSWNSLWSALEPDENGVATSGDVTAIDCENTLLRSEDSNVQLVGLGVKNIVAVAMRDAVLVADMNQSQRIRDVVQVLSKKGARQAVDYPRYHRPWGWYETLCLGGRFQVKRIMVKPGGVLSLQSHVHRAEHWVVVQGTAKVTVDEKIKLLSENESVYVPLGAVHRLENPGKVDMYLIEVQTGSYLGEDDIVRYKDVYARVSAE